MSLHHQSVRLIPFLIDKVTNQSLSRKLIATHIEYFEEQLEQGLITKVKVGWKESTGIVQYPKTNQRVGDIITLSLKG